MYFIRAWIYYSKLKSFGDFPIITEVLPDNQSVLTEKSVRQPRNLVARFIINQLDSAAKYMVDDISETNAINKELRVIDKVARCFV